MGPGIQFTRLAALFRAWPLVALLAAAAGCDRAGGESAARRLQPPASQNPPSLVTRDESLLTPDASAADVVGRIERLRAQGHFEEFIDAAILAADEQPDHAALQWQKGEAQLASGRPADCEASARRAAILADDDEQWDLAVQALKLWATARFRQSKSLDDPALWQALAGLPSADANVQMLTHWRDALGQRPAYHIAAASNEPVELKPAMASPGTIPFELAAVQATANGAPMPRVFIDTGAHYTLITTEAARDAGVNFGDSHTQLIGFAGLVARPGVIETLELGDLILRDVPVMVGDSTPLVANAGQMSLGTELLYHVRFHIDYPARRVTAEPADRARAPGPSDPLWEIPVWTFSQICLARGQSDRGPMARVLVDTGDRAGTFVSYRWARQHMPNLRGVTSAMVFRFKKRNMALDVLDLGSQTLRDWPVLDTIPTELDRLNQVDIILGHDLLWPYRLTIDLPHRELQLRPGSSPNSE
jgi:Aspartyl protease